MRVLFDTNILIFRENHKVLPSNLSSLQRILQKVKSDTLVHPLSIKDIQKDTNKERREISLSKINAYTLLETPPLFNNDKIFLGILSKPRTENEIIDFSILYCLYRDAVDFLVTEDKGIIRNAGKLGVSERVFTIDEALNYFIKLISDKTVPTPAAIRYLPVHNLDFDDPILDSLKNNYSDFSIWWKRISKDGRMAWVYFQEDGKIGAILILKHEDESVDSIPPLERKPRLKICTLKVEYTGFRLGESFLKTAFNYAIGHSAFEIYLTHITERDDTLIELINRFGFRRVAKKGNEDVFLKKLLPTGDLSDPRKIHEEFYPSFYDGISVDKFIVPIQPKYHLKLFNDYGNRQTNLFEFSGDLIVEGNMIEKAYLSHSKIRKIKENDILLFYRSDDLQRITSIGVVEKAYLDETDPEQILKIVGKRSVFTKKEIEEYARKPTKVILFKHLFFLDKEPGLLELTKKMGVLGGPPQTTQEISHEDYLKIKKYAGIDERFTVN